MMQYKFTESRRWCLVGINLLLLLQVTFSQVNNGDKIPVDSQVKIGKLANGLTYYIRQNKKPEQKVELRLVVNAGSVLEDDDQQGLAHMGEHMAFNGTKHFKKNEIVSFLQDIGVGFGNDLNAYTSFDETVYILPIPTDKPGNLEKGFQILEDWAHNVTYLDADIDGERAVILEESRMGKGANDRMFRKIFPRLFEGSKYANRLPIGLDSIIKNFKPDVIRRFYKEWYRPNLMAVIVVGDIEPARAETLIRKHFTGLTNPANARSREAVPVFPYNNKEALIVTDKEATSYVLSINYPAKPVEPAVTVGDYRNDMVEQMFTSLVSQRLQEQTQQENPPFLSASVGFNSYARGYEAFNAYAMVGTGDINKGLNALATELERVKRYGFTATELERAKKNLLNQYERHYNNRNKTESGNFCEEYIRNFISGEPIPGIAKEFEYVKTLLPGITLEEVNAIANVFKNEKNRFVYVMGPDPKAGEQLPANNELLAVLDAKEKAVITPYEENVVATSLLAKMPAAGKIVSRKKNAALGTTELVLSNGVTVTLKPTDFKADQILLSAARPGGRSHYPLADKYSATYATAIVEAMGVGNFSPTDLRKVLAGKTVSVKPGISDVYDAFRGSASNKDVETLFQLIYLYATQPRRDTALFKSFIQKNKSQYAMLGANPQAAFVDTLYRVLFNNNPLTPVIVPKSEYFDKVNLDRVLAIYNERFGDANGMHFTLVGSFTEAQMESLVQQYLAALPATKNVSHFIDNKVRPVTGNKIMQVNKGKEQKSLIVALYNGEIPYSEDMDMKAQAISEILNIRIIEELREKIQGIYGGSIAGELNKTPYNNYSFVLQLPCGPEKADTLLKAAQKEIAMMVQKGPAPSYLDKVKKQWLEQYKTNIKENEFWLGNLQEQYIQGADPKRFLNYEGIVARLTIQDIQAAAKQFFNGKNVFIAVLMPEVSDKATNAER